MLGGKLEENGEREKVESRYMRKLSLGAVIAFCSFSPKLCACSSVRLAVESPRQCTSRKTFNWNTEIKSTLMLDISPKWFTSDVTSRQVLRKLSSRGWRGGAAAAGGLKINANCRRVKYGFKLVIFLCLLFITIYILTFKFQRAGSNRVVCIFFVRHCYFCSLSINSSCKLDNQWKQFLEIRKFKHFYKFSRVSKMKG